MEIMIDTERCQGYGQCALNAPDLFEIDPDGKSRVLDAASDFTRRPEVERAAELCPMQAIRLLKQD